MSGNKADNSVSCVVSNSGKIRSIFSAWSASIVAPPPEHVKPTTCFPLGAPTTQRNFKVSSNCDGFVTLMMPTRWNKASYSSAEPESDPVWLTVKFDPIAELPVFSTTTGLPLFKAFVAAFSNFGIFCKPSRCNPIARTAGSSAKNSNRSSGPKTAWLPAETM